MTPEARNAWLRELGAALEGRDLATYAKWGRDPDEPIVGGGPRDAPICVFGRDPGRDEVRHGEPFVGQGGQKVRKALHAAIGGGAYDFDAGLRVGRGVFWANMVPFKPVDNKAWSPAVVREFRPVIADLLAEAWQGRDVLALGDGAFRWFGLDDPAIRTTLDAHWARDDRYEAWVAVPFAGRTLRVHPLPHPSPLNRAHGAKFPSLIADRLVTLGFGRGA